MSLTERATKGVKVVAVTSGVILAAWLLVAYTDWTVNHIEAAGRGIGSAAKKVGGFFAGLARAITN